MCDTCHRCGDRHALGATRRRASMARAGQARCRRRAYSHRRSPTIIPERRQNLATPISWHASPSRANARTRERRRSIHSKAYNALVEGIAADLRDGHIWTKALAEPRRLRSAGIILVRRGGRWVVAEHDRSCDEPDLRGLELLSCDGEEAQLGRPAGSPYFAEIIGPKRNCRPGRLGFCSTMAILSLRSCDFAALASPHISVILQWRQTDFQVGKAETAAIWLR